MRSNNTVEDVQFIDGLRFTRYTGNKYYWWKVGSDKVPPYRKGTSVSAHRYVWERANGPIPDGYQIHHKDHDASNNTLDNLEMVETVKHASYHAKKRLAENEEFRAKFHAAGIEAAKAWHKSEEGRTWHREHAKKTSKTRERDGEQMVCTWCGKTFIGVASKRKKGFCSMSCQGMARKASGVDDVQRTCEECGTEFMANKYSKTRFCNPKCAGVYSARKRLARKGVQPDSGNGQ